MQLATIEQRLIEIIDFDIPSFFARTKGESLFLKQTQIGYTIAFHWLFKLKVKSHHKIPYNRQNTSTYKKKGESLFALLNLIEGCFNMDKIVFPKIWNSKINHPIDWFACVIIELILYDLNFIREGKYNEVYPGRSKQSFFAYHRALINQLADPQPPIPIAAEYELINFLYQKCYDLANYSDLFRKNYWQPYITALRAELRFMRDSPHWNVGFVECDRIVKHHGKGKAKVSQREVLTSKKNLISINLIL